jgi:hypothetical protein
LGFLNGLNISLSTQISYLCKLLKVLSNYH